jgi:DNA-binding MarR family transcriptional regulator
LHDPDADPGADADPDPSEVAAEVDELLRRVLGRLGGQPAVPPDMDLTMAQLRLLWVLSADQPLSVGQIADRLAVGQPSTSRMVDRLLQDGYVDRWDDPADRRRALVGLTDHGRRAVESLARPPRADEQRVVELLARLDPTVRRQLVRGLRALLEAAEGERRPASDP